MAQWEHSFRKQNTSNGPTTGPIGMRNEMQNTYQLWVDLVVVVVVVVVVVCVCVCVCVCVFCFVCFFLSLLPNKRVNQKKYPTSYISSFNFVYVSFCSLKKGGYPEIISHVAVCPNK